MIDASTRLRRAIHLKDASLVRRIITANPKLLENPDFTDKSNTSLHIAAKHGLVEIAKLLLDAGHDATEISRNAEWDTPLILAVEQGHVEMGSWLITRCPQSIPWANRKGVDVLATACLQPLSTPLIPLLLSHADYPSTVHSRDNNGNTPLHHASAAGSLKALRLLLQAGADPNATNAFDWTPLAYSQTVAAEVYFKNLIAEYERRKTEGRLVEDKDDGPARDLVDLQQQRQQRQGRLQQHAKRKGAGVRLITDEGGPTERPGTSGDSSVANTWSPASDIRRAMTPTAARAPGWSSFDGPRARASSGE